MRRWHDPSRLESDLLTPDKTWALALLRENPGARLEQERIPWPIAAAALEATLPLATPDTRESPAAAGPAT